MNIGEIAERLITAAEITNRFEPVGPAPLRAQQLPYVHSAEDMRNWGHRRGERRSRAKDADACRLDREDEDAHAMHRREFWEGYQVTARMISEADEAIGWYSLVEDEDERHALAAWARCMADPKRLHFQDWCAAHGFTRETGRRRKNRALDAISAALVRSVSQNSETDCSALLHSGTVSGHFSDTNEAGAGEECSPPSWMADHAFTPFLTDGPFDFSWAAKRNERRRQREAEKAKKQGPS